MKKASRDESMYSPAAIKNIGNHSGQKAFSLLEVMVATVILAGTLLSISRIVSYSYSYTERINNIYLGTELASLKMHDVEEEIKKNGIPTADKEDEGTFDEKAYEAFKWRYSIKRVHIPIPDIGGGSNYSEGTQEQAADMMMGAKSMIEDFIKERIRKLTLEVWWGEGKKESEKVTFTVFIQTEAKEWQQAGQAIQGGTAGQKTGPRQFGPGSNKPMFDPGQMPGGQMSPGRSRTPMMPGGN